MLFRDRGPILPNKNRTNNSSIQTKISLLPLPIIFTHIPKHPNAFPNRPNFQIQSLKNSSHTTKQKQDRQTCTSPSAPWQQSAIFSPNPIIPILQPQLEINSLIDWLIRINLLIWKYNIEGWDIMGSNIIGIKIALSEFILSYIGKYMRNSLQVLLFIVIAFANLSPVASTASSYLSM